MVRLGDFLHRLGGSVFLLKISLSAFNAALNQYITGEFTGVIVINQKKSNIYKDHEQPGFCKNNCITGVNAVKIFRPLIKN